MKVPYINILLFALPLNILAHNNNKSYTTPLHTRTNRSLCECDIYESANYDNDPQMKKIMENFNKQTQQRFEKYEEHMVEKRKCCKDKCDKEIQKIILKDKLEKELMDKFSTLHTDIQSDAIPTCVCEKSVADKTEKFCLNCGKTMGGVAPGWGLVGGLMYAGWSHYIAGVTAKAFTDAGISTAIELMGNIFELSKVSAINLTQLITPANFNHKMSLVEIVNGVSNMCDAGGAAEDATFCTFQMSMRESKFVLLISKQAGEAADAAGEAAKAAEIAEAAKYTSTTSSLTTGITASVVAIVVIVLIMVIIYLVLRYRRKKKMKKKLQYIKLLEE
ncbi:rifin PIR protein, putative [Plasmodium reichenowi]|uniref:Rifin PIR protein, putative n=1 Tax=Plasmodium reichenowi TaxID=5854 RepID=A0A2P9DSZ6_PLARE|nr:rifin PIR protein, putative [Plasmodium reichenowi]